MNSEYLLFRDQVLSVLHKLAKDHPLYGDAQMLIGSAETQATLYRQNVIKRIDTDWIDVIEKAIPALDAVIRKPNVAIKDIEEILPLELSRHTNDRSVKHLATHTNLISNIVDEDVIPQKLLNVYHDETYLTYENKFVNTLLVRLAAFINKRYQALLGGRGVERTYKFHYETEFEHYASPEAGHNTAQVELNIRLTSPVDLPDSVSYADELNEKYQNALARIERLNMMVISYRSSIFGQKLGRAYIRPPVIRTNAILKNKDMRECLHLWEFIETFDKVGYSVQSGVEIEMSSNEYVTDLHSTVALQYANFYNGVSEQDNRLLSHKDLYEVDTEFHTNISDEEINDYLVYDSEYRKLVPVSRLMSNRKNFSEDEHRISTAITVALKVDDILEDRRREEERRLAKEEAANCRAEEKTAMGCSQMSETFDGLEPLTCGIEEAGIVDKSAEVFLPENGALTNFYPLCPYTRRQYLSAPRKVKKQIKINISRMRAYSATQQSIRALRVSDLPADVVEERIALLEKRAVDIRNNMPFHDDWQTLVDYHTV